MCGLRRDFEIRQNLIFKICADAHTCLLYTSDAADEL